MNEEFKKQILAAKDFKFYSIRLNQIIEVKENKIQLDNVNKDNQSNDDDYCLVCPELNFVEFNKQPKPCSVKSSTIFHFKKHLITVSEKYNRKIIFLNNESIPDINLLKRQRELTDISEFRNCEIEILNKQNEWTILNKKTQIKCDLLNCNESKCTQSIAHHSRDNFLMHLRSIERKSGNYLIRKKGEIINAPDSTTILYNDYTQNGTNSLDNGDLKMNEELKKQILAAKDFKFYSIRLNQIIEVKEYKIQLDNVNKDNRSNDDDYCLVCPELIFVNFNKQPKPCTTKPERISHFKKHLISVSEKYNRKIIFLNNEFIPEINLLKRQRELTDISEFKNCEIEILNKQNEWTILNKKSKIKCDLLNCNESKCIQSIAHHNRESFLYHLRSIERKSSNYLIRKKGEIINAPDSRTILYNDYIQNGTNSLDNGDSISISNSHLNSTSNLDSLIGYNKELFSTYELSKIEENEEIELTLSTSNTKVTNNNNNEQVYQIAFNNSSLNDQDSYYWFIC